MRRDEVNMMKSFSLPKSLQWRMISRITVLVFLLVLLGIGAVPSYLSGKWSWQEPPQVANLKQIKQVGKTGLELPGWKTLNQKTETLGGHTWSIQELGQDSSTPVRLMLRPLSDRKSQPEVEWIDINEYERWQTDSYTQLQFTVEGSLLKQSSGSSNAKMPNNAEVEARFFRAWNPQQTFAVLQWYAWPGGGHPAPSRWFFMDQLAQLRRERVPWIAVCLQIPIEPLGDLKTALPSARSLGQKIQAALMAGSLARASSS